MTRFRVRLRGCLVLSCLGAACDLRDYLVDAPPTTPAAVAFTIVEAGSASAFAAASQQADRAWVDVTRVTGEMVVDTIVPFAASAQELRLQIGTPTAASGGHRFRKLDTGQSHTCGIEVATDRVLCWGRGTSGELGDGSTTDSPLPRYIAGTDAFDDIAAGGQHTCGVRTDRVLLCWGSGTGHQLGNGVAASTATPTPAASAASFASVSVGGSGVSCAIDLNDAGYCWGTASLGMLGNGTGGNSSPVPAPVVGGHAFAAISVGGSTVCALVTSGSAFCWGSNQFGQLGIGSVDVASHPTPQPVAGGHAFTAISAGTYHVCAVTAGGTTYCWGARRHGILGDGSLGLVSSPQRVQGF